MKKLLLFTLGAVIMQLLARNVQIMHLPPSASMYFGFATVGLTLAALWEKLKPDERDRQVTWQSSHIAFLGAAVVLTGVLLYQSAVGAVDPWLLAALGVLAVGKIAGRLMSERRSG